jgi:hypothetical protein
MEKFIHDENIRLYRRLLAEATDTERRRVLLKLLADEEAKDQRPPERMLRGTARDRSAVAFERKWRLRVDCHAQQNTAI